MRYGLDGSRFVGRVCEPEGYLPREIPRFSVGKKERRNMPMSG